MDVAEQDFQQAVLDASHEVPVVVDFWAPWCGPCRVLGPILEKLEREYGGRFRLAKVNSDENLQLAREFNIRSIPDVRAFHNGKQVAQFMGALPEPQVRAFIERVVPSPAEIERLAAQGRREAGDLEAALAALRKALSLDANHVLARIDLADALIEAGQHEAAGAELDRVPENIDWATRVASLRQAIAFAASGGSVQDLAAKIAANPSDLEARAALAGAHAARKAWREAMDELLEILRREKGWRNGEARKQMLAIFNLATDAELVATYRRKLASTLN